eukprot:TRINITY_DN15969_c0_g2_i1.p3 TRINITY_DN15969_c0_g2~~TRINITY_DN15969_c0_g2_i1.p3  ORF type:complete len:184 (+),score=75.71 TRINITY_DN15969_c0_g2_i1:81-632(+)
MAHVMLNVCGQKYEVLVATLLSSPETMLGALVEKWNNNGEFSDESNTTREIFIDRNGDRFQYILDWYRDGRIFLPKHIPYDAMMSDVQFFRLPQDAIATARQHQVAVVTSINGGRCYIEGAVTHGTDTLHRSIWGCPIIDNTQTPFPVLQSLSQDGWSLVATQEIPHPTVNCPDKVIQYVFRK